jgi:RNA-directed DNA polymerase
MLKSKPYDLAPNIAAAIAKAATLQNKLPLGAPTSPVLSNLICAKLDTDLSRLAREHNCTYSRYVDDITFSTHRNSFALGRRDTEGGTSGVILARSLVEAIENNGFRVNSAKTRIYTKTDRQEVTGLIVNERVNIKRTYIRNTRAMLHSWKKFGLASAELEFKQRFEGKSSFQHMLQGRVSFIGQIRGRSDSIFKKLSFEYNKLAVESGIKSRISTKLTPSEICTQSVWVLEGDGSNQGTAVFVYGVGLVTCNHCLSTNNYIYHRDYPGQRFSVEVIHRDKDRDLAILKAEVPIAGVSIRSTNLNSHESIYLAGYPNHSPGRGLRKEPGYLIQEFPRNGVKMMEISPKIIEGNSGGPVLDSQYRLVGIAKAGVNKVTAIDSAEFLAISAEELKKIARLDSLQDTGF